MFFDDAGRLVTWIGGELYWWDTTTGAQLRRLDALGLGEGALLLEGEPETLKSSEGVGACVAAGQLLAVALGIIVDAAVAVTPGDMVPLPQCDGAPLPEEEWEGLPDELAPAEAEKVALEEPVEHTVSERSGEPL
jgi:hypothetical protein